MRIECGTCYQTFTVPAARMPKKKRVAFPCPVCSATIQLDFRSNPADPAGDRAGIPLDTGAELKTGVLKSAKDILPFAQTLEKAHLAIADLGTDVDYLVAVVESDPALAMRVLRLANSPFYHQGQGVGTIREASVVIGVEALKELLSVIGGGGLQNSLFPGYRSEDGFVWQHTMAVAHGARMIAQELGTRLDEDAYTAGLLHDLGKYMLDPHAAAYENEFDQAVEGAGMTWVEAEQHIFGFDHGELAYEYCVTAGLPLPLCTAIKYHHCPEMAGTDLLPRIVYVADLLSRQTGLGGWGGKRLQSVNFEPSRFIDLPADIFEGICSRMADTVDRATEQIWKS